MIKMDLQFFGGRGAGGGDSLGNGRGNNFDFDRTGDIMSLNAPKSSLEFRNNVMNTVKEFFDEYPALGEAVNDEMTVKITKGDRNVLAFWEDGTNRFAMNEAYVDSEKMQSLYDQSIKEKYHPKRGKLTAEQAVTAHEFGHALTTLAANKANMTFDNIAKKIIKSVSKDLKTPAAQMAQKISGYAKESNAECIAEAVCEVKCLGNRATAESKAVYNELKKYL